MRKNIGVMTSVAFAAGVVLAGSVGWILDAPSLIDAAQAAGQGSKQYQGGGSSGRGQSDVQTRRGKGGIEIQILRGKNSVNIYLEDEGDDSDAPPWAGVPGGKSGAGGGRPATSGSKKGDLFGDLWVILRDANGVPILTTEGYVQPLDANGNLVPLDEEGHPIDGTLTVEVEMGRLNVGRSPSQVLDRRAAEVITLLNAATAISLDPAGRLVLTVDGEEKTIDSPLENLALYVALVENGTIAGVSDLPGTEFDFMVDGTYTVQDLDAAKAFLAAATDKTGVFTSDEIAYINSFLGINTTTSGSVTYSVIDYSTFTYDRSDTYGSTTAEVLVQQPDGTWVVTTVNIYDAVFKSVNYTGSASLDAYTQAADDARMIIEFIHEFAVPETVSSN